MDSAAYLQRDLVRRRGGLLDAQDGLLERRLRMRLEVQHVVGRHVVDDAPEPGIVRAVEEEFFPEAGGQFDLVIVIVVLLCPCQLAGRDFWRREGGGEQHPEERFVETDNLGLEDLRARDLRERRWFHRVWVF